MTVLLSLLLSSTALFASSSEIKTTDFSGSGTYMVPVKDQTLLPFSLLEVSNISFKQNGDEAFLTYELPLALTGVQNKFELEGKLKDDGSWRLRSSGVEMNCREVQGFFNCPVDYREITVDESARLDYIKSATTTPADFDGMLNTARFFDGERIGVLRFKVSP